ncbi:hypothetical protein Dimus_021697, partial [Dionaea muscipula]
MLSWCRIINQVIVDFDQVISKGIGNQGRPHKAGRGRGSTSRFSVNPILNLSVKSTPDYEDEKTRSEKGMDSELFEVRVGKSHDDVTMIEGRLKELEGQDQVFLEQIAERFPLGGTRPYLEAVQKGCDKGRRMCQRIG